jgi:hypothetical protein
MKFECEFKGLSILSTPSLHPQPQRFPMSKSKVIGRDFFAEKSRLRKSPIRSGN